MLSAHALDWASTQRDNCRTYLLSPTGRFQQWCQARSILGIADLTTDEIAAFLAAMADRQAGPGLKAATLAKYRTHLRSLARFGSDTPGFNTHLADIDRIPVPRMPKETFAPALSRDEEERILAACSSTRDRLIIELFLATGVRVSEMAALVLPNLALSAPTPDHGGGQRGMTRTAPRVAVPVRFPSAGPTRRCRAGSTSGYAPSAIPCACPRDRSCS